MAVDPESARVLNPNPSRPAKVTHYLFSSGVEAKRKSTQFDGSRFPKRFNARFQVFLTFAFYAGTAHSDIVGLFRPRHTWVESPSAL